MKNSFSMFYAPDEGGFKKLWEESIIVFDANVLLNLYRYTIKTKDIFLNVIESLSDRVFIPHQVALEYHSNRMKVIIEQADAYQNVRNILNSASLTISEQLKKELNDYSKKHPIIDVNSIKERISESFQILNKEVEDQEKSHPNYVEEDSIRKFLEENIKKIGKPFTVEELGIIYKDGEVRYKQKRPPGYKDAIAKKDDRKYYQGLIIESVYGDLLVWSQVMEEAKAQKKSVIFVTDDTKDDWWKREHGKTVGPRVELIDEFIHNTQQEFYMYESHRFLEYAQKYLAQAVDKEAVKEVQELYAYDEKKNLDDDQSDKELIFIRATNNTKGYYRTILKKQTDNFDVGDKVKHKIWGLGRVLHSSEKVIAVLFPSPIGIKKLNKEKAPIEKYYE